MNSHSDDSSPPIRETLFNTLLGKITSSSDTTENLKEISNNQSRLNDYVEKIDSRLDSFIDNHDELVVRMYKVHVDSIKKEFTTLLEENFNLKSKAVNLSDIEKSAAWLKNECLNFSKQNEKAGLLIKSLKKEVIEKEEHVLFLEKQLQVTKKQNHFLKVALNAKESSKPEEPKEPEDPKEIEKKALEAAIDIIEEKVIDLRGNPFASELQLILKREKKSLKERESDEKPWEKIFKEACGVALRNQGSLNARIYSLEKEAALLRKDLKKFRDKLTSFFSSLNNIQKIFLNCLEAVKKSKGMAPDVAIYRHKDDTFLASVDIDKSEFSFLVEQRAEAFRTFFENQEVIKAFLDLLKNEKSIVVETQREHMLTSRNRSFLDPITSERASKVREYSLPGVEYLGPKEGESSSSERKRLASSAAWIINQRKELAKRGNFHSFIQHMVAGKSAPIQKRK